MRDNKVLPMSEPEEALRRAFAAYEDRRLTSFSMVVVHHGYSYNASGDYTQNFRWRKGGRFTRIVTKPGPNPASNDYYDGKRWVSDSPVDEIEPPYGHRAVGGVRFILPAAVMPNSLPDWEEGGGPIVTILMRTPNRSLYEGQPKTGRNMFSFGSRRSWQGMIVTEVVVAYLDGQSSAPLRKISVFVDRAKRRVLGVESQSPHGIGWYLYKDQQFNPPLPSDLGKAPPAKLDARIVDRTVAIERI